VLSRAVIEGEKLGRTKKIKELIARGEGIDIEFKESKTELNKDVFETVCAFLNRNGGNLFLGINNAGKITGIENPEKTLNEFISLANNPQRLSPTFYFSPEIIEIGGKKIIYIYVPVSSQVHNTKGKIFDRNSDGDFDITNNSDLVSEMYLRKQTGYSENIIYPYAELSDLRKDLLERVRIMVRNKSGEDYLISKQSDLEMLKSFGLIQKDYKTGKSGITLAGILLFGKDETIINILSHHRTDAILRRKNKDRYDDRDDIRTNLLDSYDRLMSFVKKYLPDPFYLEDDTRVSLRNKIFREAVANILIHREYLNAYPAKMIIEENRVIFENANRPHGYGLLDPESFSPYPKNPKIARVFKEIGLADELGSGVRNLFKYCKIYADKDPELIEEDVFKINIALPGDQAGDQASDQAGDQAELIMQFCTTPRSIKEIMEHFGYSNRTYFRKTFLNKLIAENKIVLTIPENPNNPKQKYVVNKNS